jgi:hypothetical protein
MYKDTDFVITATRDEVRHCETPLLVLPDDTESHPYVTAMEMANLARNAQVSIYPWKAKKETVRMAVNHVRTFLRDNCRQAMERSNGVSASVKESKTREMDASSFDAAQSQEPARASS